MRLKKTAIQLLLALCVFCGCSFAASPAGAGEVAVIDMAGVIDASNPGKAGQKYLDNLKAGLETELQRFKDKTAKSKDAERQAADKQRDLNGEYQAEYDRVTALIVTRLRVVIREWINSNRKGVMVVVPAHTLLGFSDKADISGEILRAFNSVAIDFSKKK